MKNNISDELYREVERFLYAEASLLEENRFGEWLTCFASDVRYWMPVRERVQEMPGVTSAADTFTLFDEDKKSLELRVLRLQTGTAHAEVPFSVTQRLVTNIMVETPSSPATDSALFVQSRFMVYQERRGLHGVTFCGRRKDVLRPVGAGFEIASRKIELAQQILPTTLSIFF
jgi:3-phenylpropionate/cinnamic acid dioxygenase small subunit